MLKSFSTISTLSLLPILNQLIKTQIAKSTIYKKTIEQTILQLKSIDIKFQYRDIGYNEKSGTMAPTLIQQKQQFLFEQISNPEVEKMISTRLKNRIQTIKELKINKQSVIRTNCFIAATHSLGTFTLSRFFYYSAFFYALISQVSLINDIYTLRTGKKIFHMPFKSIGQIYSKFAFTGLAIVSTKKGIQKISEMKQVKDIKDLVKRE